MRSPSTVSTMRTVPCIAGCAGPMLTVMRSGGSSVFVSESSCASLRTTTSCLSVAESPMLQLALDRIDRQIVAAHERLALLLRIVFAQRIADELFVHVDAAHVGMTVEADAVHVERLALLPVERRP